MSLVAEQREHAFLRVAQALQEAAGLAGGIGTGQHQRQAARLVGGDGGAQLVVDGGLGVPEGAVDDPRHVQLLGVARLQLLQLLVEDEVGLLLVDPQQLEGRVCGGLRLLLQGRLALRRRQQLPEQLQGRGDAQAGYYHGDVLDGGLRAAVRQSAAARLHRQLVLRQQLLQGRAELGVSGAGPCHGRRVAHHDLKAARPARHWEALLLQHPVAGIHHAQLQLLTKS
mmetsp:Transcript_23817/g.34099  ORF Transcript_23817/g.34099 Transcript_23817/m.34099 type:complete len:226 (+) Transcript_23817:39-716(+)